MFTRTTSWMVGLLVIGLLLALSPATALAQTPYASVVVYEVREGIQCNPGGGTTPDCSGSDTSAKGFGTRIADATLLGGLSSLPGGAMGGAHGEFTGGVSIEAASILSKIDWTGPIHGKWSVVQIPQVGGKILTLTISGQLDLSPAMFHRIPLAPIDGHWRGTKGTLNAGGTFAGVFLIPFFCGVGPTSFCYLELDPATGEPTGGVVYVESNETVGGVPLVKLVVSLFTK